MARLQTLEADLPERKRLLCFKIGDLRATVISDGCGEMPVEPIFAVSTPQPELASVLRRTSCGRSSSTYHALVVDTPRERILVDTGFGERSARWSQLSAAARAPPPRPDYARQHRCRCAIPRPSGRHRPPRSLRSQADKRRGATESQAPVSPIMLPSCGRGLLAEEPYSARLVQNRFPNGCSSPRSKTWPDRRRPLPTLGEAIRGAHTRSLRRNPRAVLDRMALSRRGTRAPPKSPARSAPVTPCH